MFRPEAMRGQDRLHGDVVLVPPVSWQLLGGFLLVSIAAAILFLATAQYGKVTTVSGRLAGDRGVVRAVPARAGIVEQVLVREGQQVEAGTPLVRIAITTSDGSASLEQRRAASIAERDSMLRAREPQVARVTAAEALALRAQIDGDRGESSGLSAQIEEQRELVRSAATELDRARRVAARGFVSARDVLVREELLATRRQALSRLIQELGSRRARIAAAEADLVRLQSELALQRTDLAGQRAALAGAAAADENASSVLVTAAEAGTVTGILVNRGDAVSPDRPVLSIVPRGTRLRAQLELPPAATGLIAPGQEVRIAVDAFPYATYGTVEARIDSVSAATVPVTRADGTGGEAFLVTAALGAQSLDAFGRAQPLRPGMTVSARITTRSRSLFEWLFEPLYAVRRR
ncbi:MAG TPA: HlyD family efflux transporter periplasmic adaptor subunit [Allosphingosinicella sp.]|jgi:membrane fusion protein